MNTIAIRRPAKEPPTAFRSAVITASGKQPLEIQNGILALPVAFQAGRSLDQEERNLQALLCLEALEGTEFFIADLVLRRIRLFNPRNPFPPTPQDLKEHCGRSWSALYSAVWKAAVCGEQWSPHSERLPFGWFGQIGPEPFSSGCIVPDDIACKWIRDRIERDVDCDALQRFCTSTYDDHKRRWSIAPDFLRHACASAVQKLPDAALPNGFREIHQAAAQHLEEFKQRERDGEEAERLRRREQKTDWE